MTVWAIFGRAKFAVPNPETLARFGGWESVETVPNGFMSSVSAVPQDWTILKEETPNTQWVFFGGARFAIPSPTVRDRLYPGRSFGVLWDGALAPFGGTPGDWTILKEETPNTQWVFFGGARFAIPSPTVRDRLYPGRSFGVLWDGALGPFGGTPSDETLLREETDPDVYAFCGGGRRYVDSLARFGFSTHDVGFLWDGALTIFNLIDPALGSDACDPNDDNDSCTDAQELGPSPLLGGDRDPLNPWDFADVPTPALLPGSTSGARNASISLSDVLAVLAYAGTSDRAPPVANGASYNSDLNGNGTMDGIEYDRTPSTTPGKPWRSGPPNGSISLSDALVVLAQAGHSCM